MPLRYRFISRNKGGKKKSLKNCYVLQSSSVVVVVDLYCKEFPVFLYWHNIKKFLVTASNSSLFLKR